MSRNNAQKKTAADLSALAPNAKADSSADLSEAQNAKAEQSRKNGAHSKGPSSPAGKQISSRNALKHGFAASVNVVLYKEDTAEFHAHVAGFRSSYRPQDYVERTIVDEIAA